MAPRKKPTNTKAKAAAQAPTEDQPKADKAQTGAEKASSDATSVPAPDTTDSKDPSARTAQETDAGAAASAASPPASEPIPPEQSDAGAADRIAALEGQAEVLVSTVADLIARVETLEGRGYQTFEDGQPGAIALDDSNLDEVGPADLQVTVTGPQKGFYRCGRRFDLSPVVIPANELTGRQLRALEAEPQLSVSIGPTSPPAD
ncbi:MAG: hypothetical protein AAF317_07500 [Pseudomonadota bacterium]